MSEQIDPNSVKNETFQEMADKAFPENPEHLPDWDEFAFKNAVPEEMRGGLRRYFFHYIAPGDFLRAFLEGDLQECILRAYQGFDLNHLREMQLFLTNFVPSESFGTFQDVAKWLGEDE